MSEITIEIDAAAAIDMLRTMPDRIDRAMRGAMTDSTVLLLREMKQYPAPPDGSTYTRTGTLGKSWSKRIEGRGMEITGIVGSNGNMAPYNYGVQDRDRQWRIHQGRWTTIQEAAERNRDTIEGFFESRIRAELNR